MTPDEAAALDEVPRPKASEAMVLGQSEARQLRVDTAKEDLRIRRQAQREVDAEERAHQVRSFEVRTVGELLAEPEGTAERVRGLLPANSGTLIVAQRKTGKTTFLLNLARCLVTGTEFLDAFAVEALDGPVAILSYEMDVRMLARWAEDVGDLEQDLIIVNLRGTSNPMAHPEQRDDLAAQLRRLEVKAVMVDTFARAFTGSSQNDAGEVGRFLTELDIFTREQVGAEELFLTAHAGWNGDRTRGSSALEDWADSIITLTTQSNAADSLRFISARGRGDGVLPESQLLYDTEGRRQWLGETQSRRDLATASKIDALVPLVARAVWGATSPLTSTQVVKAVRASGGTGHDDTIRKAVTEAERRGHIKVEALGQGRAKLHLPGQTPYDPVPSPDVYELRTPDTPSLRDGGRVRGAALHAVDAYF